MWILLLATFGLSALALRRPQPVERPSPRVPVPDDEVDILRRVLATIRSVESGDNYVAQNPRSSASGAYQFLDSTWDNYMGYARAKDAPRHVQDQKALLLVQAIQKRFGPELRWIPASWYAGMRGAATFDWDRILPGNRSSIAQYVNKWLAAYKRQT